MKTKIRNSAVILVLILAAAIFPNQSSAQQPYVDYQQPYVDYQTFYDELSPYGQWVDYPEYGYVWLPDVGSDFAPYTSDGHWIMTEYGWTWVSDYEWGWAPFHYGRWDYDDYNGWFWIPDTQWGPAWVTWRRANGYYGWSPMRPGISISLSFGRPYDRYNDHWTFVSDRYFGRSDLNRYYVNRTNRDRIILNSTVINNTYIDNSRHATYISGPKREDVQRYTGRSVSPVTIQDNNRPGQELKSGQLRIYKPQVVKNDARGQSPAPSRVGNLKEMKQPSGRNVTSQPRNVNPSNNNRLERQRSTVNPQNNNPAPKEQQRVNPSNNNRLERQRSTVNPQNNNSAPKEQQRVNPSNNNRPERQQNTVNPQNSNPTPREQQKVNPSENNRLEKQQNTVNPQNTNPTPREQQKVNPSNNNMPEKQQNTVNPQNTNPTPNEQQKVSPSNARREQQSNTLKSLKRNAQLKESKSEENRKKKNQ